MKKTEEIRERLKKLSAGTISEAEKQELEIWLQDHDVEEIKQLMDADWGRTVASPDQITQPSWQEFRKKLDPEAKKPVRVLRPWMAAAASVVLLVTVGLFYLMNKKETAPAFAEIVNTAFEKKEVRLEDGTVVWIKHNSRIKYPLHFAADKRTVELTGEAFFEVQKDATRPFIVGSGDIATQVLGTSFNINAYPGNNNIEVALVEGKVRIDAAGQGQVLLSPGEQFIFNKAIRKGNKHPFKGDTPYAWMNGVIYFNKVDVQGVINILEQWYDVKFTLEDTASMKTELVHRVDTKRKTLEQVLNDIDRVSDYTFEIQAQKQVIVKPKK